MTTDDDHLLVDDSDGGIRTITINRPEVKNALTTAMRARLCDLLAEADGDPDLTAVIIAAVDPVFTAGVDFTDVDPSFDRYGAQFRVNPGRALRAMTTPVICAVNGACVSGGLEIVLSSTMAIASDRARFADTHAKLGVVATWGLTALLPRAVGVAKATEMSLTGRFVEADEALRCGLVTRVVAHEELGEAAKEVATAIIRNDAAREVLELYELGRDLTMEGALALESQRAARRSFDAAAFRASGK